MPSETEKLEIENKRMEERLQQLRNTFQKQKETKDKQEYSWKSGQVGALGSHAAKVLEENTLRRQNIHQMKSVGHIQIQSPATVTDAARLCGQCETISAIFTCKECTENYCRSCFTTFHRKGALAQHHALPLPSMVSVPVVTTEKSFNISSTWHERDDQGNSMNTSFDDEAENQRGFADAVQAWRDGVSSSTMLSRLCKNAHL